MLVVRNQATGAWYWPAKCRWAGFCVEGTTMGWGTWGLRGQGDVI